MPGFMPDTNCIIAAVSRWHEHHQRAATAINRRLDQDEPLLLATHSLIETYSVLTRLPRPRRLSPAEALTILETGFLNKGRVFALDSASYLSLLRQAPPGGIVGGRVYDAVIATIALQAQATTLLTFNATHFRDFARQGLQIVVP